jgi:hypothetical protein
MQIQKKFPVLLIKYLEMRVNINKFITGGQFVPVPQIPRSQTPPPAPAEAPIEDTVFQGMTGQALDNDAYQYQAEMQDMYRKYSTLPTALRNSSQGRWYASQLKGNTGKLNEIKNSKATFDKVMEKKEKAMSEYAADHGKIMVMDASGQVGMIAISTYAQDIQGEQPKYKALTNEEVASLRRKDPRFVGRDDLIGVIQNATSTDEVVERIRKALTALGNYSKGEASTNYQEQEIESGANEILSKTSYSRQDEGSFTSSNAENIKKAANAMWANLDDASKDHLRIKAANYGYKPGDLENAAMGLAIGLLNPATREIIKTTDKEGKPTTDKSKKVGADNKDKFKYYDVLGNETGAEKEVVLSGGGHHQVKIRGRESGSLQHEGKEVFDKPLTFITELGNIGDMNSVYFGDKKLNHENFDSVIYEGGKVNTIYLPFREKDDGSIEPLLNRLEYMEDIQKKIKEKGITDPTVKEQMYREVGFDHFDEKGEPTKEVELMPFYAFEAVSNSKVFGESSQWYTIHDEKLDWYKKFFMTGEGKKKVIDSPYFGGWSDPDILKGTVLIPKSKAAGFNSQLTNNGDVKVPSYFKEDATYNTTEPGGKQGPRSITKLDPNAKLGADQLNTKN